MKTLINYIALFFLTTIVISCNNDDDLPEPINEEETITTVKLNITEKTNNTTQTIIWKNGKSNDITLESNKTYTVKIQFLDESNPNDVDNITQEVIKEKDEHFIFYETTTNGLTYTSATDDTIDSNTIGINLSTDWTTTTSTTGTIKAFLIHEPTSKTGKTRDDFGGETDIEVAFKVVVK